MSCWGLLYVIETSASAEHRLSFSASIASSCAEDYLNSAFLRMSLKSGSARTAKP
jgi:hypothetical protein